MSGPEQAPKASQKASLWRSVKAVAWSFVGLRKNSEYQKDLAQVNPFHVIAVGIAAAVIFVLGLVALVNWVVAK